MYFCPWDHFSWNQHFDAGVKAPKMAQNHKMFSFTQNIIQLTSDEEQSHPNILHKI